MLTTWMPISALTQTRAFFTTSSIGTNPSKRFHADASGLKRHNADYGTGTDLAPGGAD